MRLRGRQGPDPLGLCGPGERLGLFGLDPKSSGKSKATSVCACVCVCVCVCVFIFNSVNFNLSFLLCQKTRFKPTKEEKADIHSSPGVGYETKQGPVSPIFCF